MLSRRGKEGRLMKRKLVFCLFMLMMVVYLIGGCATDPSPSGIVVSSSITYGYYYKYLSLTIYNASNFPFQVTSVAIRDLDTGENLTMTSTGGEWLYPGQTRTSTSDPISYYVHGSAQVTVCGRFSNARTECDSTIITL